MRTRIVGLLLSCFVFYSSAIGAVGVVDHKIWMDGTTTDIPTLITFFQEVTTPADEVRQLTQTDWNGYADTFVSSMSGWITPPVTGEYTFYFASDDHGVLYLSSDDTAPAITTDGYICSVDGASGYQGWGSSSQISAPVTLEEGKFYAFISLHREGSGGDHQSIGWQGPGMASPVVIASEYIRNNADVAGCPEPTNGNADAKDGLLSWYPPVQIEAATYNVTVYDEPNIEYNGLTATELDLGSIGYENYLQYATEYTWRVDAVEANGTIHQGTPYTFTTNDGVPDITAQPVDTQVYVGNTATFTVTAESIDPSDIEYEWFKVDEAGDISMGTAAQLNIPDVVFDNKGDYYCVITNDVGTETTDTVTLYVTRGLVHRYSFTEDPNDSVGTANGTVIAPTNNIEFVNGQAVFTNNSQYGSNNANIGYIDLPNGMFSDLGRQFTFIIWFTWDDPLNKDWVSILDFGNSNDGENTSNGAGNANYVKLCPRAGANNNPLRIGYTNNVASQGEKVLDWTGPVPRGEETCVALVWDEFTKKAKMYKDGVKIAENDLHVTLAEIDDVNNWIGRAQWPDSGFSGLINELRLYDEALSTEWISEHYKAGPDAIPTDACAYPPVADLDGDCNVDLADFSLIAAEWLDCGLISCQ